MSNGIEKKHKKQKEYSKKWYEEHKQYMKEFMKEYYKENKLDLTLYQKEQKLKKSGYNKPMKNLVRKRIINELNNYKINNILTLESDKFYFSKELPEKKIIVFERDLDTFNKMNKTKPKNVSLFLGDISGFKSIDMNIDFIYLDFCGTWNVEKETLVDLSEHLKNCKLLGLTFALRDNTGIEKIGDHQFDLLRKIQELTELNFKVIYGETYRGTGDNHSQPMITILLENKQ
jgi:hypothetical protein